MKNIRHIFFDLDNTLWDHRKNAWLTIKELYIKEEVEAKFQLNFDRFYNAFFEVNENLWALIRDAKIDKAYLRQHRFYDSFLIFGIDDMEMSQRFEMQFLDEILSYNHLVDGTEEILHYLQKKNYSLHVISNGFEEVTHRKMEMSGIKKFFSTITSADEINIRKPQPELFQYAFDKSDATKENAVMIGDDWIADIIGAKDFGLHSIFLDTLDDRPTESENINVITDLREICNYL